MEILGEGICMSFLYFTCSENPVLQAKPYPLEKICSIKNHFSSFSEYYMGKKNAFQVTMPLIQTINIKYIVLGNTVEVNDLRFMFLKMAISQILLKI